MVAAGHNPMELKRGIDAAVAHVTDKLEKLSKSTKDPKEIAQVGTISANGDTTIGEIIAEAMEKVGKEGVITVEEAKGLEPPARRRRGHAVRPRLPLALLRHRPGAHGVRARGRLHPHLREEGLQHEGPASGARGDRPAAEAPPDHRRGRRGRGPRDPRRQQAPWHAAHRRRQGAGLRRPPQGDAQGHRHPHRRPGRERGARHQARERHPQRPRPGQAHHHRQGRHHHRRRRRQEGRHQGPHRDHPPPDRRRPAPTTTARSSRSASRSSWAAWPSSRSARRPRSR